MYRRFAKVKSVGGNVIVERIINRTQGTVTASCIASFVVLPLVWSLC